MNCTICQRRPIADPRLSRLDEWCYYMRICIQCGAEQLKLLESEVCDETDKKTCNQVAERV